MQKTQLISTVIIIGILDFIGNRLFETCRFQIWYKPVCISLIFISYTVGYQYWKKRQFVWLKIFWSFIYSFIIFYFLIYWALEITGYYNNNFIYKTYIHIGSTPLTFGFLYLIELAAKNTDNVKKN